MEEVAAMVVVLEEERPLRVVAVEGVLAPVLSELEELQVALFTPHRIPMAAAVH